MTDNASPLAASGAAQAAAGAPQVTPIPASWVALPDDFLADRIQGLKRGEIDLHVRFDVEHEPAQRSRSLARGSQMTI